MHTPGPWFIGEPFDSSNGINIMSTVFYVAEAIAGLDDGEQEANARLIAAAPELLEALQRIATMDYGNPYAKDCADVARAAIAKATGEQT